jgi:hypothetical protein
MTQAESRALTQWVRKIRVSGNGELRLATAGADH